jgi:kinesin family protein 1
MLFSHNRTETDEDENNPELSSAIKQTARVSFDEDNSELTVLEEELKGGPEYQYTIGDLTKWVRPSKGTPTIDESKEEKEDKDKDKDKVEEEGQEANQPSSSEEDEFVFRVVLLQVLELDKEYNDVFCNFHFLHRAHEAFTSEPIRGSQRAAGFFHIQNIAVRTGSGFSRYVRQLPLRFEVFGHRPQHPLHDQALQVAPDQANRPPARMFNAQLPFSAPIKPQKLLQVPGALDALAQLNAHLDQSQLIAQLPVLITFQVCELTTSGDYEPVPVHMLSTDRSLSGSLDGTNEQPLFLLRQGVQRRLRISITHRQLPESRFSCGQQVDWLRAAELVLGRVRSSLLLSPDFNDELDESVVSLPLFQGEYVPEPGQFNGTKSSTCNKDGRSGSPLSDQVPQNGRLVRFQFEAAWDTSLHNSLLLDRVGEGSQRAVYFTLSAYLEVGNRFLLKIAFNSINLDVELIWTKLAGKLQSTSDHHQRFVLSNLCA